MKNKYLLSLLILMGLTILTAGISIYFQNLYWILFVILGLSGIKFLIIVFQFMELKKAHAFWKVAIVFYVVVFMAVVGVLLNST